MYALTAARVAQPARLAVLRSSAVSIIPLFSSGSMLDTKNPVPHVPAKASVAGMRARDSAGYLETWLYMMSSTVITPDETARV